MIKFWAIPEHLLHFCLTVKLGFPGGSDGKESTCNGGNLGSIPGLGRSPGEWNGYPLQYSGLENSMDCIVHGSQRVEYNWVTFTSLPRLDPASHTILRILSHTFSVPKLFPRGQVHQQCWMAHYIKVHLLCVHTKGQSIKTRITTTMFAKQFNWHVWKWTLLGNPLVESRMTAVTSQAKQ